MTEPDFCWSTDGVLSNRIGPDNMDGRTILIGRESRYARPWNQCIPFGTLANENLPPFHVRLRDDQVGHLARFARSSHKAIPVRKLGLWWSWDFDLVGKILPNRSNWGPAYVEQSSDPGKMSLRGGPPLPIYVDPCLPPTYTSSDKIMPQGTSGLGLESSYSLKRKATNDMASDSTSNPKKPCLASDNVKIMKAENKDPKLSAPIFETKPRLFVDNYSAKEALSFYETLTSEVRRSQDNIQALEKSLETNAQEAEKDYDELHTQWTNCYEKKKDEIEKLKVELVVSDALLKSSQATVTEQGKQLAILAQTQALLQEKEHEISSQKEQLARWETQARAMLGGNLPNMSDDEKSMAPRPKANLLPKTKICKGDKNPVKAPQRAPKNPISASPTIIKSGTNAPIKIPQPTPKLPVVPKPIPPPVAKSGTKPTAKPNGIVGGKYTFPHFPINSLKYLSGLPRAWRRCQKDESSMILATI